MRATVHRYIHATGKLGGMFTTKLFGYDDIAFEVVEVLYHITGYRSSDNRSVKLKFAHHGIESAI